MYYYFKQDILFIELACNYDKVGPFDIYNIVFFFYKTPMIKELMSKAAHFNVSYILT